MTYEKMSCIVFLALLHLNLMTAPALIHNAKLQREELASRGSRLATHASSTAVKRKTGQEVLQTAANDGKKNTSKNISGV